MSYRLPESGNCLLYNGWILAFIKYKRQGSYGGTPDDRKQLIIVTSCWSMYERCFFLHTLCQKHLQDSLILDTT